MEQPKIRWKKLGGGSFRTRNGRIIKPNQVFEASVEEIPKGFRDVVVPLEALPQDKPLEVPPGNYQLRSRGAGWYDIIDAQGKVVNENALRQDGARKLLEDLRR